MTQPTDQDRAEFEAAYVAEKLRIIGSEGSADGEKAIRAVMLRRNADGEYDNSLEAHFAWWAWQAARRASVVPQGWELVPQKATDEMLQAAQKAWLADPLRSTTTLWVAMLAAAPQPPENQTTFQTEDGAATRPPEAQKLCNLCKDEGGYFYGRTGYEPCCV